MAGYFVYVCQKVIDRKELETYWAKIVPTLEGYGANSLAAYTHFEQLEGDEVDGAAVIEFPSFDKAKEWYESPAYRAIRHHRMNGAKLYRSFDGRRSITTGVANAAYQRPK
jgi:uncharacterized protein (DUF1330 family)